MSSIDFDGDGYSDVIYGDWNAQSISGWDGSLNSSGGSFMYFFSGAGLNDGDVYDLSGDSDFFLTGPDDFDYLGSGLGGGDYNNDGYDDLIISTPGSDANGEDNSGCVYIVDGEDGLNGGGSAMSHLSTTNPFAAKMRTSFLAGMHSLRLLTLTTTGS